MINDNDVPLFDLPTLDSYAGAYETQQALNHAALFGARYRIQFISSSVFSWLDAPDNAEDAQLDGEMLLAEALNELQSQGLTFVQSGSMQTSSLEGSGVANWALDWIGAADAETDYVHEVTVQLNAISPNLSAEALENLIDNAKLSLTLNGMLNNVQEEQYLEASSVKEIAILLLSASALLASSGFVFVSVHPAAADRVKSIVDSAVAPISAALLLYFATKLK
tara:strand:+ start:94 stop:762 length:669 start_codon:yes stop_codon:yes gene_type:complete